MRSLVRKVVAGDRYRKSRLHDAKGNLIDAREWFYLPLVLQRAVFRYVFQHRFPEPWWTFSVKKRIANILRPGMTVIEYGSGYSSIWLAEKGVDLESREDDPGWYDLICERMSRYPNARLRLLAREEYADLAGIEDGTVDFCVIDGYDRSGCAAAVLPKMRAGGWIYLDNTDADLVDGVNKAERILLAAGGSGEYYTGFTIGSLNTHQGMLYRVSGAGE